MDPIIIYYAIGRTTDREVIMQYCLDKSIKANQTKYEQTAKGILTKCNTISTMQHQDADPDSWHYYCDQNYVCFIMCTSNSFSRPTAESLINESITHIYDKFPELKDKPNGDVSLAGCRVLLLDIFIKYVPMGQKYKELELQLGSNTPQMEAVVSSMMNIPEKITVCMSTGPADSI